MPLRGTINETKLLKLLPQVAHGTEFRQALEHLRKSSTGAMIIVADDKSAVTALCENHVNVTCAFYPSSLLQLLKTDGAVMVDSHFTRIIGAGIQMTPVESRVPSLDRDAKARRIAEGTDAEVVTVSGGKKGEVVVWCGVVVRNTSPPKSR